MKTLILGITISVVTMSAIADEQACISLVHDRTLIPSAQLSDAGVDKYNHQSLVRQQGDYNTYYQCDGKGNYRQWMDRDRTPSAWSPWRSGNEWNAVHWMQG